MLGREGIRSFVKTASGRVSRSRKELRVEWDKDVGRKSGEKGAWNETLVPGRWSCRKGAAFSAVTN